MYIKNDSVIDVMLRAKISKYKIINYLLGK